jgi:hypothetical protein
MAGSKAIDFYAFSWGVPQTPACNLIETAQRKSQQPSLCKIISTMRTTVTMQAYANHFGVTRPTIHAWLRRYNEANKEQYDPKNMQSVFDFFEYLQKQFGRRSRFSPQQT